MRATRIQDEDPPMYGEAGAVNGTVLCATAAISCNDCFICIFTIRKNSNHIGAIDVIAGIFILLVWDLPQQLA